MTCVKPSWAGADDREVVGKLGRVFEQIGNVDAGPASLLEHAL
jgi:hypothetical protein